MRRRRTRLDLRPIPGYRALPIAIDETVESDLPPHFSLGTSALGQVSTVTALVSAEVVYRLVQRVSFTRRVPLVTLSDPVTLALASDTLRRAFLARDNLEAFRPSAAVWYPGSEQSVVYAAGAARLAADTRSSSHVLVGTFGTELVFFLEHAARQRQRSFAHSTSLNGQAVAYVMADHFLIGEELFVGSAYLQRGSTVDEATLLTLDVLRWLVIIFGITLGVLLNVLD
ncbi:MAG: hypothetical protein HC915_11005 [Anaerolineae bacterium]|nr:hypothetical protein [Anaerolineae bacterium]